MVLLHSLLNDVNSFAIICLLSNSLVATSILAQKSVDCGPSLPYSKQIQISYLPLLSEIT